jgi:hypothetical protein
MDPLTLAVVARVPVEGVADFQAYEANVLPLLADHGGTLERRLRAADGTVELHVLRFASRSSLDRFRSDPLRRAAANLLARSGAVVEAWEMDDVENS